MMVKHIAAYKYKEIEIKTEIAACIPSVLIKRAFDYCVTSGKKVFITSDMYLSRDIVEKILTNNGYLGVEKIYLSCEERKTKMEGSLYDVLLKEQGIRASELLHIGDNVKSDILRAKQKGIHVYKVKDDQMEYRFRLDKDRKGYTLFKFCSVTNPYEDIYSDVGYTCFGPLLYGFVSWVEDQARKRGHERLFFLSRDGYIMQKAYETIKDGHSPESKYFYASRRALQVPALHFNPDYEYVMSHMFVPRKVSTKWLLRRWGLQPEKYKSKIDIEEEFNGSDIVGNIKISGLYNELKADIINNSEKEYKAFQGYLDKNVFSGNVAIVDIGWYGNMQNSMMEMLMHMDRNIQLTGYYLGIVPDSAYQDNYDMHGYLFQKGKNEDLYPKLKYMSSMMELFFMAPHGSAKRYTIEEDNITVELSEFEFEGTDIYKKIRGLQSAALKFVADYHKRSFQQFSEMEYLAELFERFTNPDIKIACKFGDLQIWDDKWITLAPNHPLYKWVLNPKDAIKRFINVSWKIGYLKRNIKLPLRYDRIVYKSRDFYKK